MPNDIDISEDVLRDFGNEILEILLKDRTTGGNIIWATNDYDSFGSGYSFSDPITIDKITGEHNTLIQPRVKKDLSEQKSRSRDMAEVFTPSWICNAQNNLVDTAWFGRKDVFNIEVNDGDLHSWSTVITQISDFPVNKTWKHYIKDVRLEMACGEAPYLASRYDTTNGNFIPVRERIGFLDRKLRIVSENTPSIKTKLNIREWRRWALRAYQSIYGFEWQGDNLLLARETLLWSYIEHYKDKWGQTPDNSALKKIAEVISWNVWQMDGLKYCIPGINPEDANLFKPSSDFCKIMQWTGIEPPTGNIVEFRTLLNNK